MRYAARVYRDQTRNGTGDPYVTHLLAVAAIVGENDGTEDEVIAALLHDAPEDAGGEAQPTEIRARFGDGVADIVAGCTDPYEDPKAPWRARKEDTSPTSPRPPPRAPRLRGGQVPQPPLPVPSGYRAIGEDLWGRLNGGRGGTLC